MKMIQQVDSHNSMLTNKEMAILSAQIDILALNALQSLRYESINAYFNAAEHYYGKLKSLIQDQDQTRLDSLRNSANRIRKLIEDDVRYRNRRALQLFLDNTKEFYFETRDALQKGKYYFRVSAVKQKGLDKVPYYDNPQGESQ